MENYNHEDKNRPFLYSQRFLIMIFPDIFTCIANTASMIKAARKLKISWRDKPFENLQLEIREITDEYFKTKGIYNEIGNIDKFAMVWFLVSKEWEKE